MSARTKGRASATSPGPDEEESVNEVRLVGRLSQEPIERTLPSGDALSTFRVVVNRRGAAVSRVTVDALDCSAWTARTRRTVNGWREGDVVEVTGAVRRRFFRGVKGPVSRVEVEVRSGRLIRRRATA